MVRIDFEHFRRMIKNNVIDFVTDNIQNFFQLKLTKEQRIGLKNRWESVEFNTRNTVCAKTYRELHIHQKVAVIAVAFGDQEQLCKLHELQKISAHFAKQGIAHIPCLYCSDIFLDTI